MPCALLSSRMRRKFVWKLWCGAEVALIPNRIYGGEKSFEKGGKVLDIEWRKVVNYKLPAQITGALFDR